MNRTNYYLSLLSLHYAIESGGKKIRNLEKLLLNTDINIQLLRLSSFTNQMLYPEKNNELYYKKIRRYRPLIRGNR